MKDLIGLATDLEQRAASQDVIGYNELAKDYGLPKVTPESFQSHPFCSAFGLLDQEDITHGRPLRTAVVYSKVLNRPGNGFFQILADRRGQSISESRQVEEWTTELNLLKHYYSSR